MLRLCPCAFALAVDRLEKGGHLLGKREEMFPDALRQRFHAPRHLFPQDSRDEPLEWRFGERVQKMQRHGHGQAVERMSGIEAVT